MYKYVEKLYILPINIVVLDEYTHYISYFIKHNGDDEPHDDFIPFFVQAVINTLYSPRTKLRTI